MSRVRSGWSTSTENGAVIVGAHTLIIRKTTSSDCLGQPASDQVTQEANGEILTTSYPGWITATSQKANTSYKDSRDRNSALVVRDA